MRHSRSLPKADAAAGRKVLKGLAQTRSLLTALEVMRDEVGPAFRITLPGFRPAVFVGPQSVRQIMVSHRQQFHWRSPSDPVTRLLRHGLLVEDGNAHDCMRAAMEPALQKPLLPQHIPAMQAHTDRVLAQWSDGSLQDMLVQMRRVALLIFMGVLLDVPFEPDMERLWRPILRAISYISPGLWIIWPHMPRPGYGAPLAELDAYLYDIIAQRRERERAARRQPPLSGRPQPTDLLTLLTQTPALDDDLIRDQLLTMLIAGHDTSTALLAWSLHLMARHPGVMARAQAEVDAVAGREALQAAHLERLTYLDQVIKEALRLYPPIHVANRIAAEDTTIAGYELQAGSRVMASIYLTHRDERVWPAPQQFRPERFAPHAPRPPAFSYVPFGAGPRLCIGAAFAQVEAKVVLARILQQFQLTGLGWPVRPHMGATLEPHPGVFLRVQRRQP